MQSSPVPQTESLLQPPHTLEPPMQIPPEQVSFEVQASLSSHDAVLFVYAQLPALQVSLVHGLLSLHWELFEQEQT